jgi:hypothetical protein
MSDWKPLSRRLQGDDDALYDGVPSHLDEPLSDWVRYWSTQEMIVEAALGARVPYKCTHPNHSEFRVAALKEGLMTKSDPQRSFLDIVESVLHQSRDKESVGSNRDVGKECAIALERILQIGGSKWRVENDHIEARVDDALREAVLRARTETKTTSASTHLRDAWTACYGRNPNPTLAYSEAIKAVEAAAAPVISPNDLKATLGTMLGQIRPKSTQWRFAIAPGSIDPVITAMSTIWDGQTDGHAGNRPTTPITQEAAQAAVLLAASVVHWFATGAVTRR